MNKEQLIKMIEILPIEELNGFKIYYYSEKEKESYGYSKPDKREEHNVSYGLDYDQLHLQKMDRMNDTIRSQQEEIRQLSEKIYEMGNKYETTVHRG